MIDTFGTSEYTNEKISNAVQEVFDLRPAAIIENLQLRRPIYQKVASYGHMGREELGVSWEKLDKVEALKKAINA